MADNQQQCSVNLNNASVEELSKVPGLKNIAKRIVEFRDMHGPFKGLDELEKIPGVSKIKESLKDCKITL